MEKSLMLVWSNGNQCTLVLFMIKLHEGYDLSTSIQVFFLYMGFPCYGFGGDHVKIGVSTFCQTLALKALQYDIANIEN